jgi:long-chain acyl-CoA synthetase
MEDVQVMKPTIFCGVPRVYDRIYTGLMQPRINLLLSVLF